MDFLNGEHLKVETPVTSDGTSLLLNPVTGKPSYKVTFLPLASKVGLETENLFRETNLKHRLTVVPGRTYVPPAPVEDPTIALKARIAELEAEAKAKADAEAKAAQKAAEPAKENKKPKDNDGI